MTTHRTELDQLSDEDWGPIHTSTQSRYSEGVCEACDRPILPTERHWQRNWLKGPAALAQHIVCPKVATTVCTDPDCGLGGLPPHSHPVAARSWGDPDCASCAVHRGGCADHNGSAR